MKLKILTCIIIIILLSCTKDGFKPLEDKLSIQISEFFQGEHMLLSLKSENQVVKSKESSGSYFLVIGSYSSAEKEEIKSFVEFWWLNNKGEYMPLKLEKSKVRLKIYNTISIPYCKFKWHTNYFSEYKWQDNILYAVIYINESQILNKEFSINL